MVAACVCSVFALILSIFLLLFRLYSYLYLKVIGVITPTTGCSEVFEPQVGFPPSCRYSLPQVWYPQAPRG